MMRSGAQTNAASLMPVFTSDPDLPRFQITAMGLHFGMAVHSIAREARDRYPMLVGPPPREAPSVEGQVTLRLAHDLAIP